MGNGVNVSPLSIKSWFGNIMSPLLNEQPDKSNVTWTTP